MTPKGLDEWAQSGRIDELAGLISHHSNLYYNEATPEITDAEFDALFEELKQGAAVASETMQGHGWASRCLVLCTSVTY